VHVLEDENYWALAGELLEQTAGRPTELFDWINVFHEADDGCEVPSDPLTIGKSRDDRVERRDGLIRRELTDHLAKWPIRDPLPVRQATSCEDARLGLRQGGELSRKARLADAGLADNRDEVRTPLQNGSGQGLAQFGQLFPASDDGGLEEERARSSTTLDSDQAPSVRPVEAGRIELGGIGREPAGQLAREHIVRRSGGKKLGCCPNHGTAYDRFAAGQDLAGIHGRTRDDPDLSELGHRVQAPYRVVLVCDGAAEDGHDGSVGH
jgi:hypothetical protein